MVKEDKEPYFIGIDIGTGSTKAIAINIKEQLLQILNYIIQLQICIPVIQNKIPKLL